MKVGSGIRPHSNRGVISLLVERIPGSGIEVPNRVALSVVTLLCLLILSIAIGAGIGKWTTTKFMKAGPGDQLAAAPTQGDSLGFISGESMVGGVSEFSLSDIDFEHYGLKRYAYTISRNDNLSTSLQAFGVPHELTLSWCNLAKDIYNLEKLKPGQSFSLWATPDKEFVNFEFNINRVRRLVIAKDDNGYKAYEDTREQALEAVGGVDNVPVPGWVDPVTGLHYYRGVVNSNFYDSATGAGMTDSKVMSLVRVFGGINFGKLKKGAMFSVVVGPGENAEEEGPILAAMIEVRNKPRYVFRFEDKGKNKKKKKAAYFDNKGKSTKGSSMICPVRYTRISSPYSYRRFHPILKRYRPHLGVDYAAPSGTPVRAAASGKVVSSKWRGGFGRTVRIRHNKTYESQYAHLSRYAQGIRKGKRVRQGQVIGYVGSTGRSTGPHLDYRIYKYGRPINPRRVTGMPGPPLKDKKGFAQMKKELVAELDRELPYGPPLPWPRPENGAEVALASDN